MPTEKTPVIEHLHQQLLIGNLQPDGIVRRADIVAAIQHTGAALSTGNPANFFKDIIRKATANNHWPAALTQVGQ